MWVSDDKGLALLQRPKWCLLFMEATQKIIVGMHSYIPGFGLGRPIP